MAAPLAIFPLDVVLFPGALLPLHIFEPRYRQMLADCLERSQPFGLVQPAPDGQRPVPGGIGALALIQHHEQLPDGRSHILVEGRGRFRLERYGETDRLYSVADTSSMIDQPGSQPAESTLVQLRGIGDRYRQIAAALHEVSNPTTPWSDDPELLSFQIAAEFDLVVTSQWRMLELDRTDQRVELLLEVAPSLLDELVTRAAVHVGALSNGKGPHHPASESG